MTIENEYNYKYLKYKSKYINIKSQSGGNIIDDIIENGSSEENYLLLKGMIFLEHNQVELLKITDANYASLLIMLINFNDAKSLSNILKINVRRNPLLKDITIRLPEHILKPLIHYAIEKSNIDVINALLVIRKDNALVNSIDIEQIFNRGMHVHQFYRNVTPLLYAIELGSTNEIIQALINRGANISNIGNNKILYRSLNNPRILKLMLDNTMIIDGVIVEGNPSLLVYILKSKNHTKELKIEIIKVLLNYNILINNETLNLAIFLPEILKEIIIKKGIEHINDVYKDGLYSTNSLLTLATYNVNYAEDIDTTNTIIKSIYILIELGCDVNNPNTKNSLFYDIYNHILYRKKEMIGVLKELLNKLLIEHNLQLRMIDIKVLLTVNTKDHPIDIDTILDIFIKSIESGSDGVLNIRFPEKRFIISWIEKLDKLRLDKLKKYIKQKSDIYETKLSILSKSPDMTYQKGFLDINKSITFDIDKRIKGVDKKIEEIDKRLEEIKANETAPRDSPYNEAKFKRYQNELPRITDERIILSEEYKLLNNINRRLNKSEIEYIKEISLINILNGTIDMDCYIEEIKEQATKLEESIEKIRKEIKKVEGNAILTAELNTKIIFNEKTILKLKLEDIMLNHYKKKDNTFAKILSRYIAYPIVKRLKLYLLDTNPTTIQIIKQFQEYLDEHESKLEVIKTHKTDESNIYIDGISKDLAEMDIELIKIRDAAKEQVAEGPKKQKKLDRIDTEYEMTKSKETDRINREWKKKKEKDEKRKKDETE